jgi:hypothetical protein
VAFEERDELFLKCMTPMVLGLVFDVSLRVIGLRDADAEGAVAFLPSEVTTFRECIMNPFGRAAFDELHRLGDGKRRWEREEEVDVILHSSDGEGFYAVVAGNAAEVGSEAGLEIVVDRFAAFFRAEDAVVERTAVGVGHTMAPVVK